MSTIKLTRAQRRELKKLSVSLDRVTESDRRFFARFPRRQHRVRLTSRAEIARQELIDGRPMRIPPGCRMFTVIRSLGPDFRMCSFIPNREGADIDLDEATAREVYERVAVPYAPQIAKLVPKAGAQS